MKETEALNDNKIRKVQPMFDSWKSVMTREGCESFFAESAFWQSVQPMFQ